jgi:serine/threonine protein kinase
MVMSGFNVSNRPVVNVNGSPLTQAEQSQSLLKDYRAHISNGANAVKSGVLHIDNRGGAQKLLRDQALHMRSRKSEGFDQAADQIKSLFHQAYEGKVSQDAFKGLMAGLDAYLLARGNQLGTKTFAKLFDAFERESASFQASEQAGGKLLPDDTSDLLRAAAGPKLLRITVQGPHQRQEALRQQNQAARGPSTGAVFAIVSPPKLTFDQKKVSQLEGLAHAVDRNGQLLEGRHIGTGANANAFELIEKAGDGQFVSVMTVDHKGMFAQITENSFGHGELAAAAVRAPMPHVAKATVFVLEVERDLNEQVSHRSADGKRVDVAGSVKDVYEVPASQVKGFVKANEGATITQLAVKMPSGSGSNLNTVFSTQRPTPAQLNQVAAGLYLAIGEMHTAGLQHNDVKPANITFDTSTGQLMLVDLGSAGTEKNSGTRKPSLGGMSVSYAHPACANASYLAESDMVDPIAGAIAGPETDRYAFAMVILNTLAPSLSKVPEFSLRSVSDKVYRELVNSGDGASLGQRWLDGLMKGLAETDFSELHNEQKPSALEARNKALEELRTAFRENSAAKTLASQAFASAMPGEPGLNAWKELAVTLAGSQGLSPGDSNALQRQVSVVQAKMDAENAVAASVLSWLDADMGSSFTEEIAVLKDFSAKMVQLENAEIALRDHNGQDANMANDDLMELLAQSIKTSIEREGADLTPDRQARWDDKLQNSPALAVLSRIADRVNDELFASTTDLQYAQVEKIVDLVKLSAGMVVSLRMALNLPPIEGSWFMDPTESNTTPEIFAQIDQLFSEIR